MIKVHFIDGLWNTVGLIHRILVYTAGIYIGTYVSLCRHEINIKHLPQVCDSCQRPEVINLIYKIMSDPDPGHSQQPAVQCSAQ